MRRALAGLISLVLVAACSGDGGTTSATTAPPGPTATTAATPAYAPAFADAPCDDAVPDDPRVECGVLTVPIDRSQPDAGDVTIPVAIIRSTDAAPAPDPIVYFSGGPGFPGRDIAGFLIDIELGGSRDVILFDQRGTGASTPNADCPELVEPVWEMLGAARDPFTEADVAFGSVLACLDRLRSEGVDLDAYDTPTIAADVEDLRIALGIDEWNIFGVSYGTTVALEVARSFPEHVRSVVLDSVYPTDIGVGLENVAANARRAIDVLAAGCAADAECADAHGDVKASLQALVDAWNEEPFRATVTDAESGQPRQLELTGFDVVAGLWNAMYDTSLIPVLPSLLVPLRERDELADAVIQELADAGISQLTGAAEGMALSVDCADRQRLGGTPPAGLTAADPVLEGLLALADTRRCDLLNVQSVPAAFNEPVVSDLPALVLAGEYDPVTPPAQSERAAAGFANGTFVVLPAIGHGAVFEGGCPFELFANFVSNPTAPLETGCVGSMPPPDFAT